MKHALTVLGVAVAAVAAAPAACVSCSETLPGGAGDSGADGTAARRRDGGAADGGAPEAEDAADERYCTPEGGATHDWPGYTRVDAFHPCCVVDTPDDLDAALPELNWIPCSTGRPNCLELDHPWRTGPIARYFGGAFFVSRDKYGAPAVLSVWAKLDDDVGQHTLFDFASGRKLGSWRSDTSSYCFLEATPASATVALHGLAINEYYHAAYGKPQDVFTHPAFAIVPPNIVSLAEIMQQSATSDSLFAFRVAPGGEIALRDLDSGTYKVASLPQEKLSYPMVVGSDVFAWSYYGKNGLGWSRELYVNTASAVASDFRSKPSTLVSQFVTDGARLFWVEASGASNPQDWQPNAEVWVAPYTNDASTLDATAKKLATLPRYVNSWGVAFSGIYAAAIEPDTIWIVRASDGATQKVVAEQGRTFSYIGYVSASELWVMEDGPGKLDDGSALERIGLGTW